MGHIFWNDSARLFDSGEQIAVLALGDSWFHYPFNNLITPLYNALEQPTVYVIGESGARADELCTGSWLANFRKMLVEFPQIRLVCLSAGGNDFAGVGDLDDKILLPDCSAKTSILDCYRPLQPQSVFAGVAQAYHTIIATIAAVRPDLPVLVHNYDYAIPDGRTLAGLKSWLKLPMDNDRVPTPGSPLGGLRREIVSDLIDRFTLALDALISGAAPQHVELVWSAGTLSASQWANELHPKPRGFEKLVADCWSGPARAALGLP